VDVLDLQLLLPRASSLSIAKKSLLLSAINCTVMMRMMMRMIELVNCKRACCYLQFQNDDDDDATKAVVEMRNAQS
jgi:hypothetical protein